MGYPFSGLFATILCILIILGQGYSAFTPEFDAVTFCTNYIGIVPFFLCYVGHKLYTRGKVIPLEEVGKLKCLLIRAYAIDNNSCFLDIDFETGRVTRFDIEKDNEVDADIPRWKRIVAWII